jgi:putative oxygen-independent coproporphyrinogen III oxidase
LTEQAPTQPQVQPKPLGVYIHWPYCARICPYCDFNVVKEHGQRIEQAALVRAILQDLREQRLTSGPRQLASIFFGGGTPSLMAPDIVAALIERIGARWRLAPDIEITLEANPTSVEAARLRDFRAAGVNRASLGIQALDAAALRFLGRGHSVDEGLAALELARATFARVSFDLIYARPGQDLAAWAAELDRALALAGDHLSLYQLTIEEGTAFAPAQARGDFTLPDEDLAAALFELTQERCAAAGLPAYEISNHARPGGESRHNLVYWRYGDYLGIGPGAHGRLTLAGAKWATRQRRAPETWLAAVESAGHGTQERLTVGPAERLEEMLMMGLRLPEGVPRAHFRREAGAEPEAVLDRYRLARLIEGGFLTLDDSALRPSAAGRQRLNAVLTALLG